MRAVTSIDRWIERLYDGGRPSLGIGAHLDEIKAGEPRACIYTVILDGPARARAHQLDVACEAQARSGPHLPLFGVPVAIKDNIDMIGLATSCGSTALNRAPATLDAAIVSQLKLAGAVVLGKTNLDEAALGASGRNARFGRCKNPRDSGLLSGGSSGGSAAAVAAGHVLLAIGTDTLGSVRIPAALCGVAGFKPTHGRIDTQGVVPLYPPFDTVGLLAPRLEELEYAATALGLATAEEVKQRDLHTIWVLPESQLAEVDPMIAADYRRCLLALQSANRIRLRELHAFDFGAISRAALWQVANSFAARIGFSTPAFAPLRDRLSGELRRTLDRAAASPRAKLDGGRRLLQTAREQLVRHLSHADALFTPTCPSTSLPAAAELPSSIAKFVAAANVAGLPAVCWPQTLSPTRVTSWQMIGRPGQDLQLLRLAVVIAKLVAN